MRTPTQRKHRRSLRGVTLMELMAVIVIILLLITLAVPSLIGISRGLGVSQGGRIMASYLLVARGSAIQTRQRHRVVFVGSAAALDASSLDFAKVYRAYSVIAKGTLTQGLSDSRSDSWSFVEGWHYLPAGVVFEASSLNALPLMMCPLTLESGVATLNYIEWRPTGLASQEGTLSLIEGFVTGSGTAATTTPNNATNRAWINFDNLTGRVRIIQP